MKISLSESKQDIQNFIDKFGQDTYDLFVKSKGRLKNNNLSTDITWHTKNTSPVEMDNILATLQQKVGGNKDLSQADFSKQQIPGRYKYFGRYGQYDVYEPLDYISSMALGVNTGWCTTGRYGHYGEPNFKPSEEDAQDHFNEYIKVHRARLIYLLNPKTHYGEIAILLLPEISPVPLSQRVFRSGDKVISLNETNFIPYNAQDNEDYSLFGKIPDNLQKKLGLEIEYDILVDSNTAQINSNQIKDITLLSAEEAKKLPPKILKSNNWWWLRSPSSDSSYCADVVDNIGSAGNASDFVDSDNAVRPALKVSNLDSSNLKIGDIVECFNILWYYIGTNMILSVMPIGTMPFNKDGYKGNEYEGSDIQKYLQNWLQEQLSKNESLKRGKSKMNLEEFRKNRKARLEALHEELSNMPELTDDKAHGEVDAVEMDAIKSSKERDEKVKDSFKDKNKETREFVKKQDKDREVDKEEKSENRLLLDESLFTEAMDFDLNDIVWAVVNEDGSFAGIPCISWEEARELASQQLGRHIFKMSLDDGGKYFGGSHEWYKNESLNEEVERDLKGVLYDALSDYGFNDGNERLVSKEEFDAAVDWVRERWFDEDNYGTLWNESLDDDAEFDEFKKKNPGYNKKFNNKEYGKYFDKDGKLIPDAAKEFISKTAKKKDAKDESLEKDGVLEEGMQVSKIKEVDKQWTGNMHGKTHYTLYKIGSYDVSRSDYLSDSGESWYSFRFDPDRNMKYLPDIYFEEDPTTEIPGDFKIQTTSYGGLSVADIEQVIAGLQEAAQVIETVERELL